MTTRRDALFRCVSIWDTLFLLGEETYIMKSLVALLLIIATLILSGCSTNNAQEDNDADKITDNVSHTKEIQENITSDNKHNEESPYDEYGILYEEEISYYLSEYGTIYWDPSNEFYVLTPRNTFRQVILALAQDPFNELCLEYWDFVVEMIQLVSEEYPSAICVRNPAFSKSYLLVVVRGSIAYSAF